MVVTIQAIEVEIIITEAVVVVKATKIIRVIESDIRVKSGSYITAFISSSSSSRSMKIKAI